MPGRVFRRENHKLPSSHLSFGIHAASEGPTHELHFLFGSPQFLPLQASGNGFAQTHGGSEIGSEISSGRGSEISSGRGSESGGMKAATCARRAIPDNQVSSYFGPPARGKSKGERQDSHRSLS